MTRVPARRLERHVADAARADVQGPDAAGAPELVRRLLEADATSG